MPNWILIVWYFLVQNGVDLAPKQTIHFFTEEYQWIHSLQTEGRHFLTGEEIPKEAVHCLINLRGDMVGHLYRNCVGISPDSLTLLPQKDSLIQLEVQLKSKRGGQLILSAQDPIGIPIPLHGYLRRLGKGQHALGDYSLSSLERNQTILFLPGTYDWLFLHVVGAGNESTPKTKIKVKFIPDKGKRQISRDRRINLNQNGTLKVRVR